VVIPFGIDAHRWEPLDTEERDEIEKIQAEFGDFQIAVGRLVPYKGLEVLIRAMAEAPGRLIIVGDGPMRASLTALCEAGGVADRVDFAGDVSHRRLKTLLHACRFVVLPSVARSETFGIVQLEAMACGKAIVNTDIHPGIGWVARHGQEAITVPARNPGALADAIRYLHEHAAEAQRLGAQGRLRVQEVFGIDRFLHDTLATYRDITHA
jgi:rhamnosyl/mannosyltransferase